MRDERRTLGAALLGAAIAAAGSLDGARAQDPLPPLPPQAVAPGGAFPVHSPGFVDVPPPVSIKVPPAPGVVPPAPPIHTTQPGLMSSPHGGEVHVHQPGPIGRAFHHIHFTIKDRMVGEPERFVEPPLGWSVNRNFAAQRARADIHRFTLYRTDFLAGTDQLNPDGLRKLGRMVATLHCYDGPMLVEVDPNRPGLAEARRLAVIELAASNGAALDPDRLIVGGSPYLGGRGDLSEIYDGILIDRSLRAPTTYPLNPLPNADFQN